MKNRHGQLTPKAFSIVECSDRRILIAPLSSTSKVTRKRFEQLALELNENIHTQNNVYINVETVPVDLRTFSKYFYDNTFIKKDNSTFSFTSKPSPIAETSSPLVFQTDNTTLSVFQKICENTSL